MKSDEAIIRKFGLVLGGVFSTQDLQNLFIDRHPKTFERRIIRLIETEVLARYKRGWYVVPDAFDLQILCTRMVPNSIISFGTALAAHLMVGTVSDREVWAIKQGRTRTYSALNTRIICLGVDARLLFGFETVGVVRTADREKALLDTLYAHMRGTTYSFDIFSDIHLGKIDLTKINTYLKAYGNPLFVQFVRGYLNAR